MPPIPILIGAAVIDSINPCAFGVLIFLLAYLTKTAKSKMTLLIHGMAYIVGVFLTYLFAGIALLPILSSLGSFSTTFYAIIGSLVFIAGILEIKDFFWYGKGFSLTLIPGASERIKLYIEHITDSIFSAFFLGIFVALVELPCTGAVYLAILSMMALSGVDGTTVTWLIIYNIIFVLPLIIILFTFYEGMTFEKMEAWRKKHRALMRLAIGVLLMGLGSWMIFTAL